MNKLLLALLSFLLPFSWIKVTASDSYPTASLWKVQWINTERCQSTTSTWLTCRKPFTVTDVPNQLTARIATNSKYWLWINDQLAIFEGGLKRGPSLSGTYYDPVDIAPYLTRDSDTIAILLQHSGKDGFSHINNGRAASLLEVIIPGPEIVSNVNWWCVLHEAYQNTEAPLPNYRMSESSIRFDARQTVTNWNRASFEGPLPGVVCAGKTRKAPPGDPVEHPTPQWKNSGLLSYVSVRESLKDDALFCRLPYNTQITPYMKAEAGAGKIIRIRMDNYEGGSERNIRTEYTTREGEQEYENCDWMNNHEVYYITPEGAKTLDVKYHETGYDTGLADSLHCDDPLYDELW